MGGHAMSETQNLNDDHLEDQYGDIVEMLAPEIERRTGTDRRTLDQLHYIQRRERARRANA